MCGISLCLPRPVHLTQQMFSAQAGLPGPSMPEQTVTSPAGGCGVGNLTEPVAVSLRHWAEGAEPVAAWWSQEGPGGPGGWSSEGCQLRSSQPNVSSLHCQHLGNVAVLMVSGVGAGEGRETGKVCHVGPQKYSKDSSLIGPHDAQDSGEMSLSLPYAFCLFSFFFQGCTFGIWRSPS